MYIYIICRAYKYLLLLLSSHECSPLCCPFVVLINENKATAITPSLLLPFPLSIYMYSLPTISPCKTHRPTLFIFNQQYIYFLLHYTSIGVVLKWRKPPSRSRSCFCTTMRRSTSLPARWFGTLSSVSPTVSPFPLLLPQVCQGLMSVPPSFWWRGSRRSPLGPFPWALEGEYCSHSFLATTDDLSLCWTETDLCNKKHTHNKS